jgi:hypothetical protein
MKQNRRRCHLRPRPTRAQINAQIGHLCTLRNLLRLEWLIEAQQEQPQQLHLRLLHDRIVEIGDEIADWEQA